MKVTTKILKERARVRGVAGYFIQNSIISVDRKKSYYTNKFISNISFNKFGGFII